VYKGSSWSTQRYVKLETQRRGDAQRHHSRQCNAKEVVKALFRCRPFLKKTKQTDFLSPSLSIMPFSRTLTVLCFLVAAYASFVLKVEGKPSGEILRDKHFMLMGVKIHYKVDQTGKYVPMVDTSKPAVAQPSSPSSPTVPSKSNSRPQTPVHKASMPMTPVSVAHHRPNSLSHASTATS
jgi:hypothetical protein